MKIKRFNKKLLGLILIIALSIFGIIDASAAGPGSFTMGFSGPSSAEIGDTISVQVVMKNITNPVGGAGATLVYDSSYLQLTDKVAGTAMVISYNESNPAKFLGLNVGGGVSATSTLVTYKFKTLKEGSTSITLTEFSSTNTSYQNMTVTGETYNVTIGPKKSNNARLGSLTVTGYNYTPAFSATNANYTLSVPNDVTSVNVAATCEDTKAKMTWSSGKEGANNLNVGANKITVRCTAENGTGANYTLTVTRAAAAVVLSNDNTLKGLSVSGYSISPAFNADNLEYNLTIPYEASDLIVNAEKNNAKAKVSIKGANDLKVGNNVVEVTVTAEDGSTKTYKINVTREEKIEEPVKLDSDATLKSLSVSGYTLSPAFKPGTNVYSMSVASGIDGLNVDAIANSSKAKVEVSGNLHWEYGMNTVTITVTAENGDKNTYIVNVNRKNPETKDEPKKSGDSYLASLSVKGAELSPDFDRNRSSYEITVPYEVDKLDISYIASNKKAKVEILDNNTLQVNKKQTIRIRVTAEDGSVREYTINATRSPMSSNTYLKSLTAGDLVLYPLFDKEALNYKLTVKPGTDTLDLSAIAENPNAKVEIFGNNNLKEGTNHVMIRVTDENGFSRIYQIEVEKPARTFFGMSLAQFLAFCCLGLTILGLFLIVLLLIKRNRKEPQPVQTIMPQAPTIDFKPEFNFGSRNGTDDDIVYPNAILNQGNGSMAGLPGSEPKKLIEAMPEIPETNYVETDDDDENIPFNYYDETVTKTELIAAIKEGIETNNPEKLRMLMKQDELNKMKKDLRRREEAQRKSRSGNYHE